MRRKAPVLLSLCLASTLGCDSGEKVPLLTDPTPFDAAPDGDDEDSALPDASPDAAWPADAQPLDAADAAWPADAADAAWPSDAEPPDAQSPDAALPAPEPDEVVVLAGRTESYVAWKQAEHLWVSRVPRDGAPEPASDLGTVAPGELLGQRTVSGPPWVFLSNGPDEPVFAVDVSERAPTPFPLALYPPLRLGRGETTLLVVGRAGPEPDAPAAWRTLTGRTLSEKVVGPLGTAVPDTVTPGLDGFVFGFASGLCLAVSVGEPVPWNCHLKPGAQLVGGVEDLFSVGEVDAAVTLWTAMPGVARAPRFLSEEEAPRTQPVILAADAAIERERPVAGGRLLWVRQGDGLTLWQVEVGRVRRLPVADAMAVVGIVPSRDSVQAVVFDERGLRLEPIAAEAGPLTPDAVPADATCPELGLRPETCGAPDLDCDGFIDRGLCCASESPTTAVDLPEGMAVRQLFLGHGDSGLLFAVLDGAGTVHLYQAIPGLTQAVDAPVGEWAGVQAIHTFATRLSRTVMRVDTELGPKLLWSLGFNDARTLEPPCGPVLDVGVMDQRTLRAYCPDRAFDVDVDGVVREIPYPEGAPVAWLSRGVEGDRQRVLLARGEGDARTLQVVREEAGVVNAEAALPGELARLSPTDLALPVQAPGAVGARVSRVVDGGLQVFVPNLGFVPAGSGAWPIAAVIANDAPIAYSAAYRADPEGDIAANRRVAFRLHDLAADRAFLGRPLPVNRSDRTEGDGHHGLAVCAPSVSESATPMARIFGRGQLRLELFTPTCD